MHTLIINVLQADQLYDRMTDEFKCTYCRCIVEEDMSAMPKKDSRMQMARFNSQMEPLFELLRQVEGIKLAPEVLEPEPVDINTIRGLAIFFYSLSILNGTWLDSQCRRMMRGDRQMIRE